MPTKPARAVAVHIQTHLKFTIMKAMYKTLVPAVLFGFLFSSCAAQSRVIVAQRPAVVQVMIPPPPFPGAVWIPGHHVWQGGRYVYVSPRYVHPRHAKHWKKEVRRSRYDAHPHEKKHHRKNRKSRH